nr:2-dehydro-3-deoxyphosphooctonate aldolase 1 [Tanacetum cinerariifolium]
MVLEKTRMDFRQELELQKSRFLIGHTLNGHYHSLVICFDLSSSIQHDLIYIITYLILERYGNQLHYTTSFRYVYKLILKWLQDAYSFFVVAGPNVNEFEEHIMYMAKQIKAITTNKQLQFTRVINKHCKPTKRAMLLPCYGKSR